MYWVAQLLGVGKLPGGKLQGMALQGKAGQVNKLPFANRQPPDFQVRSVDQGDSQSQREKGRAMDLK